MNITVDDFLQVVEAHAKQGVDFVTIHAGINMQFRLMPYVLVPQS